MATTLVNTDFNFPGQTAVYHGKVRDVYSIGDDLLVMVATDRISAFDVILPKGIPYKGQALNQIAASMLDATASLRSTIFLALLTVFTMPRSMSLRITKGL